MEKSEYKLERVQRKHSAKHRRIQGEVGCVPVGLDGMLAYEANVEDDTDERSECSDINWLPLVHF